MGSQITSQRLGKMGGLMSGVDRLRGRIYNKDMDDGATYGKWDNRAWVQTLQAVSAQLELLWAVAMQVATIQ